jgi:hypothetical protein
MAISVESDSKSVHCKLAGKALANSQVISGSP